MTCKVTISEYYLCSFLVYVNLGSLFTSRILFNISWWAGLVITNYFCFSFPWCSLSLLLFWMTDLLDIVSLSAYCFHLAPWLYYASRIGPFRSLMIRLLGVLFFYPHTFRTSCPELLSEFSLCLWNLQASLLYVEVLAYFCIDFEGDLLFLLNLNACLLPQISGIFSYNMLICTFFPTFSLTFSPSLGTPIMLILCPLMLSLISQIFPSWSIVYLFFFNFSFLILINLSSISEILSSVSFFLVIRASIFYCISGIAFLVLTSLDFSSFIFARKGLSSVLYAFFSPGSIFVIFFLNLVPTCCFYPYWLGPWQWILPSTLFWSEFFCIVILTREE